MVTKQAVIHRFYVVKLLISLRVQNRNKTCAFKKYRVTQLILLKN